MQMQKKGIKKKENVWYYYITARIIKFQLFISLLYM